MQPHLLYMAVNTPRGAPNPLHFAETDACRIARAFTSSRGIVPPHHAFGLLGQMATIAAIRRTIVASVPWASNILILYWNGHGSPDPTGALAAYDAAYPYTQLAADLNALGLKTLTIILNTCHAGAAIRAFRATVGFAGDAPLVRLAFAEALERACPGARLLVAVSAADVTYEDPAIRGTRYTHALLGAIRCARGDIPARGLSLISDVALARSARRLFHELWPHDAPPTCTDRAAIAAIFRSSPPRQTARPVLPPCSPSHEGKTSRPFSAYT